MNPSEPIETLMQEHRQIERVLSALESFAAATRGGAPADPQKLARFVTFIRDYADALHHGKEEDLLFAAMVEVGFPQDGGPVGVMLHEHDQGRALVGQLRELSTASDWSASQREEVASAASDFCALLRQHIAKEDRILYPMAEARLPPEMMEQLRADIARVVSENTAADERLLRLAEELVRSEGAAKPAPAATAARPSFPSGCCH